jgi:hypothetical protein
MSHDEEQTAEENDEEQAEPEEVRLAPVHTEIATDGRGEAGIRVGG